MNNTEIEIFAHIVLEKEFEVPYECEADCRGIILHVVDECLVPAKRDWITRGAFKYVCQQ